MTAFDWLGAAGAPGPEPEETEAAMPWEPHPTAVLPATLSALSSDGAAAIGCDASMVAVAAVVICAGAIDMARAQEGNR